MRKLLLLLLAASFFALAAAACGGGDDEGGAAQGNAPASCEKGDLELVDEGSLTIGTDNPAFPPWFGGGTPKGSKWELNDPSTGEGFESAVAYAVGEELGFSRDEVKWVVVPFNNSFKPGPKNFDFDINQISYTPQRAKSVDFSESYYNVNQALVATKGSELARATSIEDVRPHKLGVQLGTTSFEYVRDNIRPNADPSVYNDSNDVISALKARQIDGIVVDLPTAFYVTAAEVPNSTIVGQFPSVGGQERFGMVFERGSSLDRCVNRALRALKKDGTLEDIQQEWLSDKADAPVLE